MTATTRVEPSQGTEPPGHPARREPLLWLQLLGLAALPLEAVLLVLVLGGADPGPFPGLERGLAWALGGLGPAVLFWRLPPDLWSLLLLQVPLRGRRPDQLRLSALQGALPLRLLTSAGAVLALPLLWWADGAAGLAWAWSPLAGSSRLIGLLAAALVLLLMQWQWHQLVQALWLFSRGAAGLASTPPLSQAAAAQQRLTLGLPLLLLAPLRFEAGAGAAAAPATGPAPAAPPQAETPPAAAAPVGAGSAPVAAADAPASPEPVVVDGPVAVAPEQQAEQDEGPQLDQQV